MDDDVLDLRETAPPSVEDVIAWLRKPKGVLGERVMKSRAADLLEQAYVAIQSGVTKI